MTRAASISFDGFPLVLETGDQDIVRLAGNDPFPGQRRFDGFVRIGDQVEEPTAITTRP